MVSEENWMAEVIDDCTEEKAQEVKEKVFEVDKEFERSVKRAIKKALKESEGEIKEGIERATKGIINKYEQGANGLMLDAINRLDDKLNEVVEDKIKANAEVLDMMVAEVLQRTQKGLNVLKIDNTDLDNAVGKINNAKKDFKDVVSSYAFYKNLPLTERMKEKIVSAMAYSWLVLLFLMIVCVGLIWYNTNRISDINERERIVNIREKNVKWNEEGKGFWIWFNDEYATNKATKKYATQLWTQYEKDKVKNNYLIRP